MRPSSALPLIISSAVFGGAMLNLPSATAAESPPTATVTVDAQSFQPAEARVARGGTVTFDVVEPGHTIVADDGSFAIRGSSGGTVPAGSSHEIAMTDEDEVVSYHCEIHPGMAGRIIVGTPAPPVSGSVIRVPEDLSLVDAASLARAGDTIDLAPGTHVLEAPLHLAGERVTVQGRTGFREDVVISANERLLGTAVLLAGSHLELRDLTIVGGRAVGVRAVEEADALRLDDVAVVAGQLSDTGVLFEGVTGARLVDVAVSGFRHRGVRVRDCAACGLWVSGLEVSSSSVGVRLDDVRGVIIESSLVSHVADGFVLAGVSGISLRENDVRGASRYGIVLAGGLAVDAVIATNRVHDSGSADLAWDGAGSRTCFTDNDVGVVAPPTLTDTASCDAEAPWSVPWPLVTAHHLGVPS